MKPPARLVAVVVGIGLKGEVLFTLWLLLVDVIAVAPVVVEYDTYFLVYFFRVDLVRP